MAITRPTKAQQDQLLNILSTGHAYGIRSATLAVLVREGWIIGASDAQITTRSWQAVQLTETIIRWLRMRTADRRMYGMQGIDGRWRFRMELLEETAQRWNDRPLATRRDGTVFDLRHGITAAS